MAQEQLLIPICSSFYFFYFFFPTKDGKQNLSSAKFSSFRAAQNTPFSFNERACSIQPLTFSARSTFFEGGEGPGDEVAPP